MKKIVIICAIIIVMIVGVLSIFMTKGSRDSGDETDTRTEEPRSETEVETAERNNEGVIDLSDIYDKTYIGEYEFRPGYYVSYTLYDTGAMVVYFWDDELATGTKWANYEVVMEDGVQRIKSDWEDGSNQDQTFEIGSDYIEIEGERYELSDKVIYNN